MAGKASDEAPAAPSEPIVLVDELGQLRAFLASVCSAQTLYLQLYGHRVGRHGDVSLLAIRAYPHRETHVVDLQTLGPAAFATRSVFGLTLRSVLENPNVRKCFWDVRSAADALWAHYRVALPGQGAITDLQLFENASRHGARTPLGRAQSRTYVHSLERALEDDLPLPARERAHHAQLRRRLAARRPATAFRRRPLHPDTLAYCAHGIRYLPALHRVYMDRIAAAWLPKIKAETTRRVNVLFEETYDPASPSAALGPWGSGQPERPGPLFR